MTERVTPPNAATEATLRARKGLAIYFATVVVASGTIEGLLLRAGDGISNHPALVVPLMWSPALASLVARLALREGVSDVSFRLGGWRSARMLLLAWLYPVAVGLLGYGVAWATHLAEFAPPKLASLGLEHAASVTKLAASLGFHLTVVTVVAAFTATGEEIGWRGYMLTRLVDAKVPRPILVSGVVWWAWHAPLVLSGQYASGPHPGLSALLFGGSVVLAGYIAARVRLESGSLWPAVLFHSAWNAVIQGTFDGFTRGGDASHTTNLWIGESGVLVVAAAAFVAVLVTWRPFPVRRTPSADGSESLSLRTA